MTETEHVAVIDSMLERIVASVDDEPSASNSARILLPDSAGRLRPVGQLGGDLPAVRRRSARRREAFEGMHPVTIEVTRDPGRSVAIFPLPGPEHALGVAELLAPSDALEQRREIVNLAVARAAAELGRMSERVQAERARHETIAVRSLAFALLAAPTSVAAVRTTAAVCQRELRIPVAGALPDRSLHGWYLVAFAGAGTRRRAALRKALAEIEPGETNLDVLRGPFADVMRSEGVTLARAGPAILFAGAPERSASEFVATSASLLGQALAQLTTASRSHETIGIEWAAHELRQPLLTVKAAIDHALNADGGDRMRDLLNHTVEEVDRLARLVDSLLEWAAGSGRVNPCPEDVVEVVREAVRETSPDGSARRITVLARGPLIAMVDRDHLRAAVAKVLENSLAYSPEATRVQVFVKRDQAHVTIRIRDRGPGVAPDERELIFQPLVRGSTGSRRRAGHGLGLFIARRVIEAHDGSISLTSSGRGTEFTIRLPISLGGDLRSAS